VENEPDETLGEVKRDIRLHDWRNIPRRDIFRKDTKIIAVVEEMKLIVRHDLVLRNPAYQKVHHA
jgi:hypothetical protein